MENVLVDSGFWFALYDSTDQHHNEAINITDYLEIANIIIPFPTLYESVNTAFMKNPVAKNGFEGVLKRNNVEIVYDESIKDNALEITFSEKSKKRNLSLVDNIIRLILEDKNYKIDYLITFNKADFIDICNNRNIQILEQ
jgi:predicted nucleic acid-binding protein